ncbi:MAG: hypothetical protein KatS3mg131_2733 [Candidatus Tectimicrobiota bacterium]|nr:MAG: hypothetical protein KatS3mg131_2733 [Candidatus Tectomicrobia bacterium]
MRKLLFLSLLSLASLALAQSEVRVRYVNVPADAFPAQDPLAALWQRAPVTRVTLLPQTVTTPSLTAPSVPWLEVQALHNGTQVAFLLRWPDATRNASIDVDRFTDAVAIELPLDHQAPPSFMMGHPGGRVHIIHWKAIWQEDLDQGFQDVASLHPNYWVDLYFFADTPVPLYAEGEFPHHPAARSFKTPEALAQLSGAYVRNPVSILDRRVPVEEAMAEGFGTLTSQPKQNATGRGVWAGGQWQVVISRPLVTDDALDAQLGPGLRSVIAFAVWDGGQQNVGARKHYAPWVPLVFEELPQ